MAPRTTRSILVTLTDSQWAALIAKFSNGHGSDPEGACAAFVGQIALEAIRMPIRTNGHEKRA